MDGNAPLRGPAWSTFVPSGAHSCRLSMLQTLSSMRPRPVCPMAAPSSCGRTASSGSAPLPPMRQQWLRSTLTWRIISCPNSARARSLRPAQGRGGASHNLLTLPCHGTNIRRGYPGGETGSDRRIIDGTQFDARRDNLVSIVSSAKS
jgi:hypothetical protein